MNDTQQQNDFPPLTIDQIRDLAAAIREDFGGSLSRAGFTDSLLMLLENVPEVKAGEVSTSLIDPAWDEYVRYRFES
ncbi:hypothetical protein [Burkholderia sp. IDO3]|uniref:hypothetical protein n=1 Tax=Burkholderia sp. IDO3 TaxID=1705310 RepID=UPI000BBB0EE0|nr:hypothetical protein [Burkholderia sp. IDO3]AXK64741.1 hypothetical protein DCN14_18870 [Burkholderia sp. IDO3]PCD61300.1 hypothetical protein CN645_13305 [Burkholderia sp. IDO3]